MLQYPSIDILIQSISPKEGNDFLRGVLIAIDSLGIELNTQIDKEVLIVLMNGLVAL